MAATIIAVTPCVAQVELTPFAGEYRPNGTFASIPAVICLPIYGGPPCSSGGAVQQAGAAIGGVRLAVWVGRRVAVEGAVGYSPSGTVTTFTTGPTFPPPGGFSCSQNGCTSMVTGSGYMLTASARILFALVPPAPGVVSPYAIAGLGAVNESGSGYNTARQEAESPTQFLSLGA